MIETGFRSVDLMETEQPSEMLVGCILNLSLVWKRSKSPKYWSERDRACLLNLDTLKTEKDLLRHVGLIQTRHFRDFGLVETAEFSEMFSDGD